MYVWPRNSIDLPALRSEARNLIVRGELALLQHPPHHLADRAGRADHRNARVHDNNPSVPCSSSKMPTTIANTAMTAPTFDGANLDEVEAPYRMNQIASKSMPRFFGVVIPVPLVRRDD